MSKQHPGFNPTAMSFAYLRRGELPLDGSSFYCDAGLSRDDFEIAHAAQLLSRSAPERFQNRQSGETGRKSKVLMHVLPDPRPDFAPPNRKLFEEDWFVRRRAERNQSHRAKAHIRRR